MSLAVNPLDPVVADLIANAAYLTHEHKLRLAELIGAYAERNETYDNANDPKYSLKRQIAQQFKLLDRMQNAALSAEHVDFSDQKAVLAASKSLMEMLQKFKNEMERESREKILEDAIKETFSDMGDDIRVKFMNILREKLSKNKLQKVAQNA